MRRMKKKIQSEIDGEAHDLYGHYSSELQSQSNQDDYNEEDSVSKVDTHHNSDSLTMPPMEHLMDFENTNEMRKEWGNIF